MVGTGPSKHPREMRTDIDPSEAWKARHAAQLDVLGLPHSLWDELHAALHAMGEPEEEDLFRVQPIRMCGVLSASRVRASRVDWLLPLVDAARRADESDDWFKTIPVPAECSGLIQNGEPAEGLAMLDQLARLMRHSSHPTHAVGCFCPEGGVAVSVAWRLDACSASVGQTEATRDFLAGTRMQGFASCCHAASLRKADSVLCGRVRERTRPLHARGTCLPRGTVGSLASPVRSMA